MASIWVSQLGTICIPKTLFLLFSFMLLREPLFGKSSPISSTHQRYRPAPGLGDGHGGVVDPSLLQQDGSTKMQNLLESLKEQFLRTFNLSGMSPSNLPPGDAREDPPEYMMELYNRFANDRTAMPTANIIRSFKNEGTTDRHLYAGVDRKVTIYELTSHNSVNMTDEKTVRGDVFAGVEDRTDFLELASRQVFGTDNSWEAFDLTAAVQRWCKSDGATTHRLEVHISSIGDDENAEGMKEITKNEGTPEGDMRIENSPEEKHKPLLIVFSDDQSSDHRDNRRELNEMIDHETSSAVLQNDFGTDLSGVWGEDRSEAEPDEEDLIQMRSNLIYDTASRIRRNAKGNHCKKQSMYVEFKDIGWDSWILAPTGYEAFECAGICSYPLTKHVTPTKHAIVQTLVNINSPQKASRACCVPTKLEPISLLYLDDTGVVTYKYKYEGMVVAECGCR
ncbi:hypothetical protein XENOCAPTIV_029108 [Xenoophorus captivus]|uniref:TGF-beta family profile domain-containing protein n=1 Tax=Xenoophorus captivus TaxID=1517983 RepID=A0ABV0RLF4_9TELE